MSTDLLRDEHEALQREVQRSRRAFTSSPQSAFVKDGYECIEQYLAMRKAGVSREDAVKGIEHVLRTSGKFRLSKFRVCDGCDGTGWHLMFCWREQRCTRESCNNGRYPEREHTYVVPCDCPDGDRFRPRAAAPDDDIAALGKRKARPKGFSRLGQ